MRDPLIRRFLIGSALTGVLVWVVIQYYGVSADVVLGYFLGSVAFVTGLIVAALAFAFLLGLCRRSRSGHRKASGALKDSDKP